MPSLPPLPADPLHQLLLLSMVLHVPFSVAWIGVALYAIFVTTVPGLSIEQRGYLLLRTRALVLVSLPVLLLTGVFQTMYNPLTEPITSYAMLSRLRATPYGAALFYKHGFVIATIVVTLALVFMLAGKLARAGSGALASSGAAALASVDPNAESIRRQATWLALLNGLICLSLLLCVTYIVFSLR
ncbi:MAG: hypothetical protein C4321_01100 [Chloroflexota bacterium]